MTTAVHVYEDMTLEDLRAEAHRRGIKYVHRAKKPRLIERLKEHDAGETPETQRGTPRPVKTVEIVTDRFRAVPYTAHCVNILDSDDHVVCKVMGRSQLQKSDRSVLPMEKNAEIVVTALNRAYRD